MSVQELAYKVVGLHIQEPHSDGGRQELQPSFKAIAKVFRKHRKRIEQMQFGLPCSGFPIHFEVAAVLDAEKGIISKRIERIIFSDTDDIPYITLSR